MKFKSGDKVKNTRPPYQEGIVREATKDLRSSTSEWYLIEFGNGGNQWTNGENFVVIETDFL